MAKGMYVGNSNIARRVKNLYVGNSNVARKVKKASVGVDNVARLFYTSDWWIPSGISATNVIAAYRFKGASSETEARTDLSGHGYTLSKANSPVWTSANGFDMSHANAYLSNSTLNSLTTIKTIIIRFAGLPTTNGVLYPMSQIKGTYGTGTKNPMIYARFKLTNGSSTISTNYPVVIVSWSNSKLKYYVANTKLGAEGVIGYSSARIYIGGVLKSSTSPTTKTVESVLTTETNLATSYSYTLDRFGGGKIYAAAFYSVDLNANQHKEVANNMLVL